MAVAVKWSRIPPVLPASRWSFAMSVIRLIAPALFCAAIATPVSADVTLRLKGSESIFGSQQTDRTEYRKGPKLRTDYTSSGVSLSTIFDVGTGRMVMLYHDRKEADVIESRQMSESFAKSGFPKTRQIDRANGPVASNRRVDVHRS
jgi:hypothetical protein